MSTSYSANLNLGTPALADTGWKTVLDTNRAILDAAAPLGALAVATKEVPSTTLNVKVAAGTYQKADGTAGSYAGTASQAIPTGTTRALYLTSAGTLTLAASYPTTAHVRLARVVAGATTITSVTDDRVSSAVLGTDAMAYLPLAGGTLADAANVAVGSTTGTKIGTATTQKIGFFNATPIVQPANTTDLRALLINVGLLATGGATPLDLNGGALAAATIATGTITMTDATNIVVGTTTGTKFGTSITQKLAFYNSSPIVQRSGAAQAAVATTASTQTTPWGFSTQAQADAIVTLVNEVRAALVALGLIKGSA